ncbi:MAG: pantoate--beta-alanine ligase [Ktedonobacterales bacterium]
MRVVTTLDELAQVRAAWAGGRRVAGFVPTMGYLHAGHLSLVARARADSEQVIASIFVNPAQFGPGEDLARYPRDLPRDLALLKGAGADVVFVPDVNAMYPPGFSTYVVPGGVLSERLEAASRPGHFRGVATVVLKLLNLVQPTRAYFGQKDAQQVAVLRRMLADLDVPVELRVRPTVREADGLAMSSRNAYLSLADRAAAAVLFRALGAGAETFGTGNAAGAVEAVRHTMAQVVAREPRVALEYADICDPDSFEPLTAARAPALLAIAARLGTTRLIDNVVLRPGHGWDLGVREHEADAPA